MPAVVQQQPEGYIPSMWHKVEPRSRSKLTSKLTQQAKKNKKSMMYWTEKTAAMQRTDPLRLFNRPVGATQTRPTLVGHKRRNLLKLGEG